MELALAGARCDVFLHDAIDVAALRALAPAGIVLGPGPCSPESPHSQLTRVAAETGATKTVSAVNRIAPHELKGYGTIAGRRRADNTWRP